ncbi:hypothetical protein GIX45_14150 [Erwinia sp. CPCC 100877]|nr:hypothetical protein [Erwinia sp. CPCC 100877]
MRYRTRHRALDDNQSLARRLQQDDTVGRYLSESQIASLLDPAGATGSADHFLRQVLARSKESL